MMQPAVEPVRPRHNLPAPVTVLVGREHERSMLVELLGNPACRLITISGPGGVGKTRLALEAATALTPEVARETPFLHGVFMVQLAALALREPLDDALATTVASALGMNLSGPDPAPLQVRNYLREKSLLLILDNFEHLLAGAAFISRLLEDAPALTVLISSRERLHLRGEHVIELDGLARPADTAPEVAAGYGAVQLFLQSARSHAPEIMLTAETAPAIVRICQLVGGLPLGIELAANWTQFLSCAEIADEIAQSLDFLESQTSDLPERQRSMRAVFASSWNLLTPAEQQALRRLAVFQGSFTRETAAAIAEASLPLLASLVNKSLVRRVPQHNTASMRYSVPEPLRQYAVEQLVAAGEADAIQACHARHYLNLLAARTADLRGPRQPETLAQLSAEIDQLRAAWRYAVARRDCPALRQAADALFHLYDMRSWFAEGAEEFGAARQALAGQTPDEARLTWGKLLAREGWLVFHGGRPREAQTLFKQSMAVLRARDAAEDLVFTLNYLGAVCSYLGEYHTTETLCHESLALTEASGDVYGRVIALSVLSQSAYEYGDYEAAQSWGEQSLALEQQIGSPWSSAFSLTNVGKVLAALGEHDAARQLFEQSLQIRQAQGDVRGAAICLNRLGASAAAQGDNVRAAAHYSESLRLFREIGNQWGLAGTLLNLGRLALDCGAPAAAARLLHDALTLALDTSAVPQVAKIVSAFEQLVRRNGEGAWAEELVALAAIEGDTLDRYQVQVARLLAWSELAAGEAALTRDQALAAVTTAATRPAPTVRTLPAKSVAPAGLTARELEVLRLVAQGLTDAQVAERLVLSRRTVHAHLASIYGKLQVNTRSAATRFAVEQGLA